VARLDRPIARKPVDLLLIRIEYQTDQMQRLMHDADRCGLGGLAADLEALWLALITVGGTLGRYGGRYPSKGGIVLAPAPPEG